MKIVGGEEISIEEVMIVFVPMNFTQIFEENYIYIYIRKNGMRVAHQSSAITLLIPTM